MATDETICSQSEVVRQTTSLRVNCIMMTIYYSKWQHKLKHRRGVVASVVRRMNEVTLRRARLVLGWVTIFGRVYHHGM